MPRNTDDNAGVSYRDIEQHLRDLQDVHCVTLRFEISLPVVSGTATLLWVHLISEPRLVSKATVRERVGVARQWPHVDHKTMAGLMLWLCFEMGKRLANAVAVPAEQTRLPWG